jgi:ubiquitin-activating enzyme E1
MQAAEEVQIDTNLYSRQIGTFGLETMGKLIKMKVLIVGMRGLGVETAKNLILAGPASVTFYDPNPTTMKDLGANFYLTKEHVAAGTSRAEASCQMLRELNPYVKTNVLTNLSINDLENYSLVCYTENFDGIDNLIAADNFCRSKKIGFLLAETMGCAGYVFSDFGSSHVITDADGEPCKSFIVVSVSQEDEALVTVHEDKRHSFQEGDFVKFVEVEGMTELNNAEPYEITQVKGPFSFKIKVDSTKMGAYTRQGVVENIKVPKVQEYHSLEASVENPVASSKYGMLETPDLGNFGRSEQLHIAIRAVHKFQATHKRYPSAGDSAEIV